MSICGNVDEELDSFRFLPIYIGDESHLGEQVQELLNLPVMAATDVRMAGLAEAAWGVARGITLLCLGNDWNGFRWVSIFRWQTIPGISRLCGKFWSQHLG